jgi:hypothetical protein
LFLSTLKNRFMKKSLLILFFLTALSANAQFWTEKSTGFTTATRGLGSISIVDANTVWAIATDGSGGGSTTVKEVTRSTNGGNTWTASVLSLGVGTAGLGLGSISAISETTAWISANPGTGGIGGVWKTTNSGVSYNKQTTAGFSSASFTNFVYFWDANNGIAQGDPESGYFEIWTTTNGGTNWTRVPSANIPLPLSTTEYGYTNNYAISGNTIWFGTSLGRLFRSTDKGLNWTVSQSPVTDFGSAAASGAYSFSSETEGLLVSSTGNIYSTSNGGTNYTQLATTDFFTGDITYVPGTSATYVTTGTTGSSYSSDNGLTWTTIDGIQHTIVAFLNESVGFTGGFTTSATVGGVSKYTGTVLVNETFESSKFAIYPNPSNSVVNITNSDNILLSEVTITDMNGRIVKTVNANNLTEVQINVADLTTGVYFMNVATDSGKAIKKFIKN